MGDRTESDVEGLKLGNSLLQQRLKAWQPFLSPSWVIGCFGVLGLAFIIGGIFIVIVNNSLVEISQPYDAEPVWATDDSGNRYRRSTIQTVNISITSNMTAPIYIYYRLTNFYQNHRRYVKSRDDTQLLGQMNSADASKYTSCDPWIQNTAGSVYLPCGLIARSVFNDTFTFFLNRTGSVNRLSVNESPTIPAWSTDVNFKFSNLDPEGMNNATSQNQDVLNMWLNTYFPPQICRPLQWSNTIPPVYVQTTPVAAGGYSKAACTGYTGSSPACTFTLNPNDTSTFDCSGPSWEKVSNPAGWGMANGHFIAWMRTAGLPTFEKLYARIDQDLYVGDTVMVSVMGSFPVQSFGGSKSIVLATVSVLGASNNFLAISYLVVGSVALVFAIFFAWAHWRRPRTVDAVRYLD